MLLTKIHNLKPDSLPKAIRRRMVEETKEQETHRQTEEGMRPTALRTQGQEIRRRMEAGAEVDRETPILRG